MIKFYLTLLLDALWSADSSHSRIERMLRRVGWFAVLVASTLWPQLLAGLRELPHEAVIGISLSGFVFVLLLRILWLNYERYRVVAAERDRALSSLGHALAAPPDHPRVAEARAALRACAKEALELRARPVCTFTVDFQPWLTRASALIINMHRGGGEWKKEFVNSVFGDIRIRPPQNDNAARVNLARGAAWLEQRAVDITAQELEPIYLHPAPSLSLSTSVVDR